MTIPKDILILRDKLYGLRARYLELEVRCKALQGIRSTQANTETRRLSSVHIQAIGAKSAELETNIIQHRAGIQRSATETAALDKIWEDTKDHHAQINRIALTHHNRTSIYDKELKSFKEYSFEDLRNKFKRECDQFNTAIVTLSTEGNIKSVDVQAAESAKQAYQNIENTLQMMQWFILKNFPECRLQQPWPEQCVREWAQSEFLHALSVDSKSLISKLEYLPKLSKDNQNKFKTYESELKAVELQIATLYPEVIELKKIDEEIERATNSKRSTPSVQARKNLEGRLTKLTTTKKELEEKLKSKASLSLLRTVEEDLESLTQKRDVINANLQALKRETRSETSLEYTEKIRALDTKLDIKNSRQMFEVMQLLLQHYNSLPNEAKKIAQHTKCSVFNVATAFDSENYREFLEDLSREIGHGKKSFISKQFSAQDIEILKQFLEHEKMLQEEKNKNKSTAASTAAVMASLPSVASASTAAITATSNPVPGSPSPPPTLTIMLTSAQTNDVPVPVTTVVGGGTPTSSPPESPSQSAHTPKLNRTSNDTR